MIFYTKKTKTLLDFTRFDTFSIVFSERSDGIIINHTRTRNVFPLLILTKFHLFTKKKKCIKWFFRTLHGCI